MTSRPELRPSTGFPLFATGLADSRSTLPPGTILLDGMEVEFARTVGFYPIVLAPDPERGTSARPGGERD
jgi:hypothetical protein